MEDVTLIFNLLEESICDMRYYIRVQNFLLMLSNLLLQGHAFPNLSHLFFDHANVLLSAALHSILLYVDVGSAIASPHMFNEIGTISNGLTLKSVDEGARTLVKAIGAAHLNLAHKR